MIPWLLCLTLLSAPAVVQERGEAELPQTWSDIEAWSRSASGESLAPGEFSDFHLSLEFRLAQEAQAGVRLAQRWQVQLAPSNGELSATSSGALYQARAPLVDASAPAGQWQRLDLTYSHRAGSDPRLSVWLDDRKVQHDVALGEPTPGGSQSPLVASAAGRGRRFQTEPGAASEDLDWGADFTVVARFRSREAGTLVSKCPPEGDWVPDAKALFLRGGRLVYDIGWVGALRSRRTWNDGEWHRVVLTSADGLARLYVDGELEGEEEDFEAEDDEAFVLKVGSANDDFGGDYEGDVSEVRFLAHALSPEEARSASRLDAQPQGEPAFRWDSPQDFAARMPAPGDAVPAAISLVSGPGIEYRNLRIQAMGAVDHAALIESWDTTSYARGEAIYSGLCIACHGADGTKTPNPKARPFTLAPLENGADPLSLFRTITDGYQDMPGNAWLEPDQRYDVIHYVRERFLRERNPSQFVEVDDAYLNRLPKGRLGRPRAEDRELVQRDYGPALSSQLEQLPAVLSVRLDDDTTIAYDLHRMASPAAWTGGFLDLSDTHHHLQRGEGRARPGGEAMDGLGAWAWVFEGRLDGNSKRKPARGPLPTELLDYHGYSLHEDQVVLSYAIEGREVWEVPGVDRTSGLPVLRHRLTIGPGAEPTLLRVIEAPAGEQQADVRIVPTDQPIALCRREDGRFSAAHCEGFARWNFGEDFAYLEIPASETPLELTILRMASDRAEDLVGFTTLLDNLGERLPEHSPRELLGGSAPRWEQVLTTRGTLGDSQGAYALDTLELPPSNPWNTWLRTSALDFFSDGRAAVSTYGGDVWIVSGIDQDLSELRWRRFAAGMFEPMGLRVVDDTVYVTCRDRIVRLHDRNDDGEADFYESFFADPDVSPTFHAFSFDLQTDAEGFFYYAKSGQYTDYDRGGSILRVAPDGSSYEEYALGLRTPNGMGMSPDGRPLVSDNQGNWIPASKISLAERGGFYGVFPSIRNSAPGLRTRQDFDPPVLWMPQGFDSSSGGQLWVDDERFGPLAGRYLHTSFGKGWMYPLVIDREAPVPQAAAWRLPFQFAAGIQRLRVAPHDGQVYAVGLSGWQGPAGGADGCLQRVRFTGADEPLLLAAASTTGGVRLEFSHPLSGDSARDLENYEVRRWNYRWARAYGSAHYRLQGDWEEGEDRVEVRGAALSEDRRTLDLEFAEHVPCDQLVVEFTLQTARQEALAEEVYLTVNSIPGSDRVRERAECRDSVGLPWLSYAGEVAADGSAPPHVVLISGDEEYRSEECLPALARVLSEHLGWRSTVLFSIDPQTGRVNPEEQVFTPGLEQLREADLVVLFTRFREWPDADMAHFVDYVESGRPILGIRTATHAFDYRRQEASPYRPYTWRNPDWPGGFGKQVLGETWVAHHGAHGSQATRGLIEPGQEEHPILRGVRAPFCPTDVYTVRELPADATVLLRGQVVDGMQPTDPGVDGPLNEPMMPVLWTRERRLPNGKVQRVVSSTIGSSQGLADPGLRRVWVQACAWALGRPIEVDESQLELVGPYEPSPFGFGRFRRDLRPTDF